MSSAVPEKAVVNVIMGYSELPRDLQISYEDANMNVLGLIYHAVDWLHIML